MNNPYNTYDFNQDTSFIPSKCCEVDIDLSSINEAVAAAKKDINDSLNIIKESINNTVIDNTQATNEKINETKDEVLNKINEAVKSTKDNIDNAESSLHNDIEDSTCHIIEEIYNSKSEICLCHMATKDDINKAVEKINSHTDGKFDEINFMQQFENLNNQLKEINDGK